MYGYGSVAEPPRPATYEAVPAYEDVFAYDELTELDAHDADDRLKFINVNDAVAVKEAVVAYDELIELDAQDAEVAANDLMALLDDIAQLDDNEV